MDALLSAYGARDLGLGEGVLGQSWFRHGGQAPRAVTYRGSHVDRHGPAVLLGVCVCQWCGQVVEEMAWVTYLLVLPDGCLLAHVNAYNVTVGEGVTSGQHEARLVTDEI